MVCALRISDPIKARTIYSQMSTQNQKEPSTQFLLYKVALRCHDSDLAKQCIDSICIATTKDATILYACVLEAQRMGNHSQSITSLLRVLDKYDYNAPSGVHLPALLRSTARLLLRDVDGVDARDGGCIESICKLFERAAVQARAGRRDSNNDLFTLAELDWFSRSSYNLALKICTSWTPEHTSRMVQSCLKFIDLYRSDLAPTILADLSLRRLFCAFLHCSLLVALARSEDVLEAQLQHYLNAREIVDDFRAHLPAQLERLGGGAKEDLQRKHSSLLTFDFEAAARLKAWPSLEKIIEECKTRGDVSIFTVLADIALASDAPTDIMIKTLQQIINATWNSDGNDIERLSRWIRCLFALALTYKSEIAEQLLDQVIIVVKSVRSKDKVYPREELEWLATTTFNHAVDYYCLSQDIECRRWAERALTLSALCQDGGSLRDSLQQKYQGLAWHE